MGREGERGREVRGGRSEEISPPSSTACSLASASRWRRRQAKGVRQQWWHGGRMRDRVREDGGWIKRGQGRRRMNEETPTLVRGSPLTTLGLQEHPRQASRVSFRHLTHSIIVTIIHCKNVNAKFPSSSRGPSGSSKAAATVRRRRSGRQKGGEEKWGEGRGEVSNPGCGQYARGGGR